MSNTESTRGDSALWLSPEPKLHGQRRFESALFDLRNVAELHTTQAANAGTKRAPLSTGFVDVKTLVGLDGSGPARAIIPPSRGLVTVAPPPQQAIAVPDRDAAVRRVLWGICVAMAAALAAMAVKVLG